MKSLKFVRLLSLARPEKMKLDENDLQGQRVKTFPENRLPEGAHTLQLPTAGLNSGIYFLQARSSERNSLIKLVLVK